MSERPRYRILLAEDVRVQRIELESHIQKAGHDLIGSFESGNDLLAKCVELHNTDSLPDLIVTDMFMKDTVGTTVVQQLTTVDISLPVLIVTAKEESQEGERVEGTPNILEVLYKPTSAKQLAWSIPRCIALYRNIGKLATDLEKQRRDFSVNKEINRAVNHLINLQTEKGFPCTPAQAQAVIRRVSMSSQGGAQLTAHQVAQLILTNELFAEGIRNQFEHEKE